jgi:hypothetical protein
MCADRVNTERALLVYRDTCPKCRFLSRLAVLLSFASVERVPINSARAEELMRAYPRGKGKLAVIHRDGFATGWKTVPALLRHVPRALFYSHVRSRLTARH